MRSLRLAHSPLLLLMATAAMLFVAGPASATPLDAQSFTLNLGNSGLNPPAAGPYANITITLNDGTHATVSGSAITGGAYNYTFVDGKLIDLNLNGTASVSNISVTQPAGASAATLVLGGSGTVDGWGSFNFQMDSQKPGGAQGSFANAINSFSFDLTKTGGGGWTSVANMLLANSDGNSIAGHLAFYQGTYPGTSPANNTGFATVSSVPEPSTIALGLVSVTGLGMVRLIRRRKQ
jgi:hypothetical protein